MADATYFLRPLNALDALDKWCALAARVFAGKNLGMSLATNVNGLSVNLNNPIRPEQVPTHADVTRFKDIAAKSTFPLICHSFHIVEARPNANQQPIVRYAITESPVAQITLEHFGDANWIVETSNWLAETFELISRHEILYAHVPQPQQDALKFQQLSIAELQQEVSKIAGFNLEQTRRQDEFFRKLATEQDERYRQREDQLQERYRSLEKDLQDRDRQLDDEHRARVSTIEKREQEHQRKVQDLDARESTVVRRELLKQIQGIIEKQQVIELSEKTTGKRRIVHVVCALSFAIAGTLLAIFAYRVASDNSPEWHHLAPLSASLLLLGSTLIYYLKWNDGWFREHARAEFQNKKLNSDILRASWLAELIFEGRDKSRELPNALVERFSEGLFVTAEAKATDHPADQVIDLLKKVSTIKVGQGGVEMTKSAAKEP